MIDVLETAPLFVMKLDVGYARAVHLGSPFERGRSVFPVEGGSISGDRINGAVIGGADWVTWRDDGAMIIDVRITAETDDGASIGLVYKGLAHADKETMQRFRGRELLGADEVYTRTAIRFETSHPGYTWLNSIIAIGKGMRTAEGPVYHVFEIK
ncbi:MAG: DUF3237 domain-containing protein [Erythrobacter sp.]|uniref:DUF3237 domain-containing protein n=1 Tax=Erythrobacter sp. TaxID=1042 RepID=UPI00261F09BC|nr:DUF3237 domain-containing protein [Erythrobacter sp.]MDJ0979701.1 DUF3237 domain-containing protein [Erythrobacter sp.]